MRSLMPSHAPGEDLKFVFTFDDLSSCRVAPTSSAVSGAFLASYFAFTAAAMPFARLPYWFTVPMATS